MMQAVVADRYGGPEVLRLEELPVPKPGGGEVLVRVRATTVGFGDLLARDFASVAPGDFPMPLFFWLPARLSFGWSRPRRTVLGAEFAGEVAATGAGAERFHVGDKVFGYLGPAFGANAQYLAIRETGMIAPMPANLGFEQAATLPYGGTTALNLLTKVPVAPGQHVLINGASGSIGSHALQLARHFGARTTAVCGPGGQDLVRSLGADHALDYTKDDFTQARNKYDLVMDIRGKTPFSRVRPALTATGRYMPVSFKTPLLLRALLTRFTGPPRVVCALADERPEDLRTVAALAQSGALRPAIDKTFTLQDLQAAHSYAMHTAHQGRIAITMP